jgi:hypothetical protein
MRTSVRETAREFGFLIAFYRVVPPVPPLMTATFALLTLTGVVMAFVGPRVERVVAPLILLQTFASSCGFAGPARRGYYDVLLTRGEGRLAVAVVQWLAAIGPGVVSFLVLGATELLAPGEDTVLRAGTGAALFLASVLPWALTAALPRFSGAIGWLLAGSMTVPTAPIPGATWTLSGSWPDSWPVPALAPLLSPVSLVGRHLDASLLREALPAMGLATAAMGIALLWVVRAEFRLETAQ